MESFEPIILLPAQAGRTLAAIVRDQLPALSWNQVRKLIEGRRVRINDELCLDSARRVREGDRVELLQRAQPKPHQSVSIRLRHVDEHVVVVEKPSGINTVRHPLERNWKDSRRELSPTLEDLVPRLIGQGDRSNKNRNKHHLRIVHRLDKETSGLLVFARTVLAERELGQQFRAHTVIRRYLALIPGYLTPRKISARLIRDRGDGRRGTTPSRIEGKAAVTHVDVVEKLAGYTLLQCRLETGRTHQIRIHLAEQGHPVCGDRVYSLRRDGSVVTDRSGAPRLALHATELGFVHPKTGESLHWSMPMPEDLQQLLVRLRAEDTSRAD